MAGQSRRKVGLGGARVYMTLIVLFAGVLLASMAFAVGTKKEGRKATVTGEIVAVDNLHHMGMLTIQSEEIGVFPNNQLNIFMNRDTSIKICNAYEPSKDISVGRSVTITYHEIEGLLPVADAVSERC